MMKLLNVKGSNDTIPIIAFSCIKELLATILLFYLFFPIGFYLGNTYFAWFIHFVSVILFDIVTLGAGVNPSICIGLYMQGIVSLSVATASIVGQIVGGCIAFDLLKLTIPATYFDPLVGPSTHLSVNEASVYEAAFTMAFMIIVLTVIDNVKSIWVARVIYAVSLRTVINAGAASTGACMNPMISIGWLAHVNGNAAGNTASDNSLKWGSKQQHDYIIVYVLAPVVGAIIGVCIWNAVYLIVSIGSKKSNRSSDANSTKVKSVNKNDAIDTTNNAERVATTISTATTADASTTATSSSIDTTDMSNSNRATPTKRRGTSATRIRSSSKSRVK